jgi:hypothetical protein
VAAGATAHHWFARPHLLGYVCLLASLFLWERVRSGHLRAGGLLLLLQVLWVNLHATFLLQLLLGAVHLIEALALAVRQRRGWARPLALLGLIVLLAAASLLNPYGWRLLEAPAPFLDTPEGGILEWEPFGPSDLSFYAFLGYALLLGWSLWRDRRRVALSELLLALFMLALGAAASRHVALFVLATLPSLVRHAPFRGESGGERASQTGLTLLRPIAEGLRWQNQAVHAWEERYSGRALTRIVWVGLLLLAVSSNAGLLPFGVWDGINRDRIPVESVEVLDRQGLQGGVFTDYGWAGYLIFRRAPENPVFIDGRAEMHGPERMEAYLAVLEGRPGWRRTLRRHGVSIVLHRSGSGLSRRLLRDGDWLLAYEDREAALYLRRAAFPGLAGGEGASPLSSGGGSLPH